MDVQAGNTADGTKIQLWDCVGTPGPTPGPPPALRYFWQASRYAAEPISSSDT